MTETVQFTVTGRMDEVEFRHYPAIWLATVTGSNEGENFTILFRYITGNNRPGEKIPMTAPVLTPVQIPMTSPVITSTGGMSFVMPAGSTGESLPVPGDERVSLHQVPAREVAVIRFRGQASAEDVSLRRERLLAQLAGQNIRVVGEPFLMRYNPPFTPGFLRRNEVAVEIRRG